VLITPYRVAAAYGVLQVVRPNAGVAPELRMRQVKPLAVHGLAGTWLAIATKDQRREVSMDNLAVAIHGSVAIPLLWIVIVGLFILGAALSRAGSKGLGFLVIFVGVLLLLGTTFGHNLKTALSVLLGHHL